MESFFRACNSLDETEIIDLLLHRYKSLDYIMQMDIESAERLIAKAREKEKESRYFLQWVVQLPNMTSETYISFSEYMDKVTGRNIDTRPISECMKELEEIKKLFK